MEEYKFDEKNGLWYGLQGDYYIPCLTLPEEKSKSIGIWGQRHLRYIKEYKKQVYFSLISAGKLNSYLADIDNQAQDMFYRLVKQLAENEGVTEKLKAGNQMEWVCRMNNIRNRATEVVNSEIIYTP
ncbi:MAG: TnpV protein [Christensenella sp.]